MTIDEALQELEWELVRDKMALAQRTVDAIRLGREALKLYSSCGHPTRCGMLTRLPGETEE